MSAQRLVKILNDNRIPFHGGTGQWPEPGEWREVEGELIPCENGLHVCTIPQALGWLGPHIWAVEVDGEQIDDGNKLVVRRARLVAEYTAWNERTARLFAVDCAERVAPLFRARLPDDSRIDDTLATVRRHTLGQATDEELSAAESAAWSAERSAARAARAAAESAAWSAAESAAESAEREWQAERLRQYLDGQVAS